MIKTDYLPRICAAGVVNDVFYNGRKAFEVGAVPTEVPTMPIEFSVAAFRLGHAMIRRAYNWNIRFDDGAGTLDWLFIFSGTGGDLFGELKLCRNWIADFRRLYDFKEASRNDLAVPAASSTARCGSTRRSSTRSRTCPRGRSAGRTCRSTTRAPTSRSAT